MTPAFLRALVLGVLALAIGAPAAGGVPSQAVSNQAVSTQTGQLCHQSRVACSVQVPTQWVAGTSGEVVVTGNPGVTVQLVVLSPRLSTDGVVGLTWLDPVVEVTTDDRGFGSADLRMPAAGQDSTDDVSAGPILIAVSDSVPTAARRDPAATSDQVDLSHTLGAWSTLTAATPLILGDGFGVATPVGAEVQMQISGAITGTAFDIQLLAQGQWSSVGTGACTEAELVCELAYQVPRGLSADRHRVRMVNQSTGLSVAAWVVRPAADPAGVPRLRVDPLPTPGSAVDGSLEAAGGADSAAVPRPRAGDLDLPDPASAVAGAVDPVGHPTGLVIWVAAVAAGVGFAGAIGAIGRWGR